MGFLHRWERDTSRPTVRAALTDLGRRALLPVVPLWALVVGTGFLIVGPLNSLPEEDAVNEAFVSERTPLLDTVTSVLSNIGGTLFIISACLVAIAVLWWRTRQWWLAVVPGIAVALQALVFITSSAVVGRGRPDVEQLDVAPPTSSFPSGHTGASTAFYLTMAMLAQRIRRPVLRRTATIACVLVPPLVATARLYRGMHSATDVAVGFLNGIACALIAWHYLRRDRRAQREAGPAAEVAAG
ncbi:phosphatase PAP2 family protein [Georgenia sp. EYE_87]|uniref:phosphatase PAP2 family protein n=1 Tax=Georgenia sp. EYE_87 TaxID=2853448 RepID=UPI0020066E87|nr:phosphatase PAP2 family protein [Georgenia sp. EYE_87]MCK6209269.1 phosphatase PAP2 family protein [Georgenia sp. EYE_87]